MGYVSGCGFGLGFLGLVFVLMVWGLRVRSAQCGGGTGRAQRFVIVLRRGFRLRVAYQASWGRKRVIGVLPSFPSLISMNDQLSHRQDGRLQWCSTGRATWSLQRNKGQIIFCHTRQKTRNTHQQHSDNSHKFALITDHPHPIPAPLTRQTHKT